MHMKTIDNFPNMNNKNEINKKKIQDHGIKTYLMRTQWYTIKPTIMQYAVISLK